MNKKILWLTALLLLLLSGCRGEEDKPAVKAERSPDTYIIYYTNLERTALKEADYTVTETSFDGMLKQLLAQLKNSVDEETLSALPAEVVINEYTLIGIDNLCIDLNAGYLGLSRTSQMLLRAALVKTLVQLPGIYHVSITVEGQPIAEESGTPIGPMDDNTFIISNGYGINFYHDADLKLFFPDSQTGLLIAEDRTVTYSSNLILAQVVAQELINGPTEENVKPVADKKTIIKSVRIEKGICILDMNDEFNLTTADMGDPEVCLYAFVNTICDSTSVRGVQFQIDGKTNVRFRDTVNLDKVFVRETVYEEETETETEMNKPGTEEERNKEIEGEYNE